jgi:hypothetical protein
MSNILVNFDKDTFNVVIENKPPISLVVNTIKGGGIGQGEGSLIQTKLYELSGNSFNIPATTHGFSDLLNFYVVKPDLSPVEVVFIINNNNDILVLSNVSLNNHSIIIKGYN